jgi:hypothetical protein
MDDLTGRRDQESDEKQARKRPLFHIRVFGRVSAPITFHTQHDSPDPELYERIGTTMGYLLLQVGKFL